MTEFGQVRSQYDRMLKSLYILSTPLGLFLAWWVREAVRAVFPFGSMIAPPELGALALVCVPTFYMLLRRTDSGTRMHQRVLAREASDTIRGILLSLPAVLLVDFGFKLQFSRTFIALFLAITALVLLAGKAVMIRVARRAAAGVREKRLFLFVGFSPEGYPLLRRIREETGESVAFEGLIPEDADRGQVPFQVKGSVRDLPQYLRGHPVEAVIVCLPPENEQVADVLEICALQGITVHLVTTLFHGLQGRVTATRIENVPVLSLASGIEDSWAFFFKRLMDLAVAGVLLVTLSPLFLLIIALQKVFNPGPIFYRWDVVGQHGRYFTSWKFRTMVVNADALKKELMARNEMDGIVFKMKDDPRITPFGRFLRRHSLDELPQLLSVLKGDMSLVGPRPPLRSEYNAFDHWHRRKTSVKPGLTCLWQVSGRNRIRNLDEWIRLDLEYIDNWSLSLDVRILLRTFGAVLKGTGL
jgi:exopolysaccharide biosynthesis polyprenyl glycosylphosphotransferase